MKIIYHHRIASKDGQYVHISEIIRALELQGHDVFLVGPELHAQAAFGHDGGIVSKLKKKLPAWLYELLELAYSMKIALKLYSAIKTHQPDVIYERYNLNQPMGVWLSRRLGIPLLLEVNAPLKEERQRFGSLSLKKLAGWVEGWTWRNASMVLPVSNALAEHVRAAGVSEQNIEVIHNGIRQCIADANAKKSTQPTDVVTIGFVGFMHLTCGVDWAMEVLAERKELPARLLCVGDGDILPYLKKRALDLGVSDRVEFTGLASRDQVMGYIDQFDIALQPDVTPYASPLKMFEYMAHKCLIVSPDSANMREILTEACAEFFPLGSKEGFKHALQRGLDNLPALPHRREAAYQRLLDGQFTWESNARRIAHLASVLQRG